MLKQLVPALRATVVLALLTGLLFPLAVTALAQFMFPFQANGSLLRNEAGQVCGSKLIGQLFSKPEYFHPRPSAAGAGYAGEASSGTNLGPTSKKLILGLPDDASTKDVDESYSGIKQLAETYRQENQLKADEKPPVDAVTRSGSGLDPDISYANALLQSRRVAQARNLPVEAVIKLVDEQRENRQFGILGEQRVNVLMLNLSLDSKK
jgi:K+-transporting ATPase ATPase C chain